MRTPVKTTRTLRLQTEPVRKLTSLTTAQLHGVAGGATAFSCGRDLCTTVPPVTK